MNDRVAYFRNILQWLLHLPNRPAHASGRLIVGSPGQDGDLQDIVRTLKAKSVALRATEQPIDTATASGKAFLDMLGVFAESETNLRRERQMEGIAAAKARGVYKGRPDFGGPASRRARQPSIFQME
ncbi:hypothetical protein DUT91_17895 [Phyllobacterium salinisoli]|uniref:Resolvase/invertase-type recombinase catalytic domain-containing protein n=1 Tax=Phyllobacterium salinisoli TaxID=1899321 RepID=A0A368K2Y7_9HYPH|nr:hypothetical protein DUT91_17895 [Phyllobacterium salinisoli]